MESDIFNSLYKILPEEMLMKGKKINQQIDNIRSYVEELINE